MVQYLVILLDDTSVSFCHYSNEKKTRRLMPPDTLKAGILYGMKENLSIQFVYPDYDLPALHNGMIESIDHVKIKPTDIPDGADVLVMDGWDEWGDATPRAGAAYVLRLQKNELFAHAERIAPLLEMAGRVNLVLTDVGSFKEEDFAAYERVLSEWSKTVVDACLNGRMPQLNVLTDRIMLDNMNNCGAGDTSITLAPDGRFYVCPAFYQSANGYPVGSLAKGPDLKNARLYKLDHAPLCRLCDAYQCRRCIWLNQMTTLEVNTPSHEQCVLAHIERNASRKTLIEIRKHGTFMPDKEEIGEIDYLDPFYVRKEW